jgi:hypothetical protein
MLFKVGCRDPTTDDAKRLQIAIEYGVKSTIMQKLFPDLKQSYARIQLVWSPCWTAPFPGKIDDIQLPKAQSKYKSYL